MQEPEKLVLIARIVVGIAFFATINGLFKAEITLSAKLEP